MRRGWTRWILALVLAAATLCGSAWATVLHNFDCKNCHKVGVNFTDLGSNTQNVCLQCHNLNPSPWTMLSGPPKTPQGRFAPTDASNAMGTYPQGMVPGSQTSHMWAGKDVNPKAGAKAPTNPLFQGRYGISTGKLTCQRCHDPHSRDLNNRLILRLGAGSTEALCVECHAPWNVANIGPATYTHPLVSNYSDVVNANPGKYRDAAGVAAAPGEIRLVEGGVGCSSCHGVHFVDSRSATADGRGTNLVGDGKLLRSDGPLASGTDAAETAQLRSNLCQACHLYQTHGGAHPIGCLSCHGGHAPEAGSTPNLYMLRKTISLDFLPKTGGPGTASLNYTPGSKDWMNAGGGGYCQGCHSLGTHNGLTQGGIDQCGGCHRHGDESFAGGSCNSCHGYAPSSDGAGGPTGHAAGYKTAAGVVAPKNESLSAHRKHADLIDQGAGNYRFACVECHADFGTTHLNGGFQDVRFSPLAATGGLVPLAYNPAADGSCAQLYCHSNGRVRGTAPSAASIPSWQGGAITDCAQCHGNHAASMAARNNSAAHAAHIARYGCNVCHVETASSSTALASGAAAGGAHVNGVVEVRFAETHNLGARSLGAGTFGGAGTCSVYCHSNGTTRVTPDWDESASGACGSCHQVGVAGVATGGGPALGGSHAAHLFTSGGPRLACTACHTNSGGGATHVDGAVSLVNDLTAVCNACHGALAEQTSGADREPVWGNAATVSCATCHTGGAIAVFEGRGGLGSYVDKSAFYLSGHGKSGLNGAPDCLGCHDAAAGGHFDGNNNPRLTGNYANPSDWCQSCHPSADFKVHFAAANGSAAADACRNCHEPHGQGMGGNSGAMLVVGTGYNPGNGLTRADYVNASGSGVCQACHGAAVNHFNNTPSNAANHQGSGNCTNCHGHDREPAFMIGPGTSCADCHGNPPASGAHAWHALVAGHDKDAEDRSDCALCHPGADQYSYDMGQDQVGGLNHGTAAGRLTLLAAAMGYVSAEQTCALACHKSTPADGAWNDADGLDCDSCHYYAAAPTVAGNNAYRNAAGQLAPLSGKHNSHFALIIDPVVCGDCHGAVSTDLAFKRNHNNAKNAAGDADRIRYQGYAFLNPTGLGVRVDDGARNAGGGNTWVNGAPSVPGDGLNTCANIACHNPSGGAFKADWDESRYGFCSYCHGFGPYPESGSHLAHMGFEEVYGGDPNIFGQCSKCHPYTANSAHRNGRVELHAGLGYGGDIEDFSPATYGGCGVGSCHNDGRGGAPLVVVTWGTARAETCALCHPAAPVSGGHDAHVVTPAAGLGSTANNSSGGVYDYGCGNCHTLNSALHMNGVRNLSLNPADGGVLKSKNQPGAVWNGTTCSGVYCHSDGNGIFKPTPAWNASMGAPPQKCVQCHNDGSAGTALINAVPTGTNAIHAVHVAAAGGCVACHGAGADSGIHVGHTNGQLTDTLSYNAANKNCTNVCHAAAGNDLWRNGATLACTDCHTGSGSGALGVGATSSHTKADGLSFTGCTDCHSGHANRPLGAGEVDIPTTYGGGTPVATMNFTYASHGSKIRLGGSKASGASEAQICWNCHDAVTASRYTLSGVNVTFTAPNTIAATGIGAKFGVGRWITIRGSAQAANNRTFKVATSSANSLTVTIPTGSGSLTSVTSAAGVSIFSPVSEWGVNQTAHTGNLDYDYGYLYTDASTVPGTPTSNWTTGFWRSAKGVQNGGAYNPFWYKRGAVQSTHTANPAVTDAALGGSAYRHTETPNHVADIRCSYCHDVHGTHGGVNGDISGPAATAGPYLRGTWKGNPYPEDGAPQWGMANWTVDANTTLTFGRVPRASASDSNSGLSTLAKVGGFWIDQNSANPNAGETLASTAGLCTQCHGSDLNFLDQKTGENLWVSGYNGHANAVIGGPGSGANNSAESHARNIFTRAKRGKATAVIGQARTGDVDMGLATEYDRGYSYRDNDGSGYLYYPRIATTSTSAAGTGRPYSFRYFVWNSDYNSSYNRATPIASGTLKLQVADQNSQFTSAGSKTEAGSYNAQANYHTFNCAKCHNPHASRLPKLMITNCLDTNHNTWDNNFQEAGSIGTPWAGTRASQWAAAQNCHRLDDRASLASGASTARGPGWNKVTPWLEFTAPDATPSTNPNP
ncbi:CxxxxCH/CxxCH domain c-type cytochrome [Geoalkalibacter sp.]|uniref:CxxxxCH/CxxCH domain c-type cytochrome n=1 Tax=Geoalkalibacter sp. TaxID=3041440 RepID=UPI00272E8076|nr:CxxxxCH/CxxCH domain-containing protein [Geoalkalibacter sp.]